MSLWNKELGAVFQPFAKDHSLARLINKVLHLLHQIWWERTLIPNFRPKKNAEKILEIKVSLRIPPSIFQMGVSKNRGTPKSSVLIGFSIIFTIHFGIPLFLETPKCIELLNWPIMRI